MHICGLVGKLQGELVSMDVSSFANLELINWRSCTCPLKSSTEFSLAILLPC